MWIIFVINSNAGADFTGLTHGNFDFRNLRPPTLMSRTKVWKYL